MSISEYLDKKSELYDLILSYIENTDDTNDDCVINYIDSEKIGEDRIELRAFLHILLKISRNHYRTSGFFSKIEKVLLHLKESIKKLLSNTEIFYLFKSNKRILLFIITEKIIEIDRTIFNLLTTQKDKELCFFFYPEIESFLTVGKRKSIEFEMKKKDKEIFENFDQKRQIGENDSYVCRLIREDSVDEFISFFTMKNMSSKNLVKRSIFETNPFLIENENTTLIEYSTFFGSMQIYDFLRMNMADLSPRMWLYSIHGKNSDIIHSLEKNNVKPDDISYKSCYEEAIKCHHNDIARYIENNFLNLNIKNEKENFFYKNPVSFGFRYHNFNFMQDEFDDKLIFNYLCYYDYFNLVKILLESSEKVDINETIVLNRKKIFQ
ncbi:hypothetical protein M9Y10_036744 [Tritrichomonas musculus]|uniref:DUF3447 domain-containing protein n=1 Tax=Tritrichomonas musculus TaxID=1915356 RepID=A0ABR2GUR0_9EUKA